MLLKLYGHIFGKSALKEFVKEIKNLRSLNEDASAKEKEEALSKLLYTNIIRQLQNNKTELDRSERAGERDPNLTRTKGDVADSIDSAANQLSRSVDIVKGISGKVMQIIKAYYEATGQNLLKPFKKVEDIKQTDYNTIRKTLQNYNSDLSDKKNLSNKEDDFIEKYNNNLKGGGFTWEHIHPANEKIWNALLIAGKHADNINDGAKIFNSIVSHPSVIAIITSKEESPISGPKFRKKYGSDLPEKTLKLPGNFRRGRGHEMYEDLGIKLFSEKNNGLDIENNSYDFYDEKANSLKLLDSEYKDGEKNPFNLKDNIPVKGIKDYGNLGYHSKFQEKNAVDISNAVRGNMKIRQYQKNTGLLGGLFDGIYNYYEDIGEPVPTNFKNLDDRIKKTIGNLLESIFAKNNFRTKVQRNQSKKVKITDKAEKVVWDAIIDGAVNKAESKYTDQLNKKTRNFNIDLIKRDIKKEVKRLRDKYYTKDANSILSNNRRRNDTSGEFMDELSNLGIRYWMPNLKTIKNFPINPNDTLVMSGASTFNLAKKLWPIFVEDYPKNLERNDNIRKQYPYKVFYKLIAKNDKANDENNLEVLDPDERFGATTDDLTTKVYFNDPKNHSNSDKYNKPKGENKFGKLDPSVKLKDAKIPDVDELADLAMKRLEKKMQNEKSKELYRKDFDRLSNKEQQSINMMLRIEDKNNNLSEAFDAFKKKIGLDEARRGRSKKTFLKLDDYGDKLPNSCFVLVSGKDARRARGIADDIDGIDSYGENLYSCDDKKSMSNLLNKFKSSNVKVLDYKIEESLDEAYIVTYAKSKGEKPASAAYKHRGSALAFMRDLKKDGYITMLTQKQVDGIDESVEEGLKKGDKDIYHSNAPDANGKFKELGIKKLASWLIRTRNKDMKKISGALSQQKTLNKNKNPEYAKKMDKVRKEVYRQLGREDLLKKESVNEIGGTKFNLVGYDKDGKVVIKAIKRSSDDFMKDVAKYGSEKLFKSGKGVDYVEIYYGDNHIMTVKDSGKDKVKEKDWNKLPINEGTFNISDIGFEAFINWAKKQLGGQLEIKNVSNELVVGYVGEDVMFKYATMPNTLDIENRDLNDAWEKEQKRLEDLATIDEKGGKDYDGDGDIDSDDYLAARDAAIKKSMSKKAVLEKIIREAADELGIFNPLQFYDLAKYGGERLEILWDKINRGEEFELVGEDPKKLRFKDPEEFSMLFKEMDVDGIKELVPSRINSFPFFIDSEGKQYSVNNLLKTADFGGKGKGSGTKAEDKALERLNATLKNLGELDVRLVEGGEVFRNITNASTITGTPKADFTLNTGGGEAVIFISHKAGKSPTDFQQYSGFKGLEEYDEVKDFVNATIEASGGELQPKMKFRRPIESDEIKKLSVFGTEFGEDAGINNVQVLLQGPIEFIDQGDGTHVISANHKVVNPSIPSGDYAPTFVVTYRKQRKNMGVPQARFGIYPAAYQKSAKEI